MKACALLPSNKLIYMVLYYAIFSNYRFNSTSVHSANWFFCGYVCHFGCDLPWTHPSGLVAVLGPTPLALPYRIYTWLEGGNKGQGKLHISTHRLPCWNASYLSSTLDTNFIYRDKQATRVQCQPPAKPHMPLWGLWPHTLCSHVYCVPTCIMWPSLLSSSPLTRVNTHLILPCTLSASSGPHYLDWVIPH